MMLQPFFIILHIRGKNNNVLGNITRKFHLHLISVYDLF